MNNRGLTLMELLVVIMLLAILVGTIGYVFITGLNLWSQGYARSDIRFRLSQAIELITRQLRQAVSIDSLNQSSITFTADLGAGDSSYRVYLYNSADPEPNPPYTQSTYELRWASGAGGYGTGAVIASDIIQPVSAVFSQSNNIISIDLTVSRQGETIRMRSKVRPRNL
ncbi:MAG: prepilin-type N-terminal cleavage/methylation domain-containing protein [Candidatus Omnitrophota bacterium]